MIKSSEILESHKYKTRLERAVMLKHRYMFFTNSYDDSISKSEIPYYSKYRENIELLLNNVESANNYFTNFSLPCHTTEVCDKIKNEMSKMFNAEDRYILTNAEKEFTKKYGFKYWSTEFYERFHYTPFDLIAVVPENGKDTIVYYDLENVKYLSLDSDNNIDECVIYLESGENGNEYFINFDKQGIYNLVKLSGSKELLLFDGGLNLNHKKDICACNFLSTMKFSIGDDVKRGNYLTRKISSIEKIAFLHTTRNILDTFGYVFKASFRDQDCDYSDGTHSCNGGYLTSVNTFNSDLSSYIYAKDNRGNLKPCPSCNNQKIVAGGEIKVEPVGSEDISLSDTIAFIAPDTAMYENREETLSNREQKLFDDTVNRFDDINNNQQQNEVRVASSLESRKNNYSQICLEIKNTVEFVYRCHILFKGEEPTIQVSFGKDYFLNSEEEYLDLIKKAKETGVNDIVDYEKGLIINKYSDNEIMKQYNLAILSLKESFKSLSNFDNSQLIQLYTSNKISEYEFTLNAMFTQIISKFEKSLDNKEGLGSYYKELKELQSENLLHEQFEKFLSVTDVLKGKSKELIVNQNQSIIN